MVWYKYHWISGTTSMDLADAFDNVIYYSMNIVMLSLVLLDVVVDSVEYMRRGVDLMRSGYKWGFIGNIN